MSTPEFVTFGETMALLTNPDVVPLRHATHLRVGVGGAESNTAIGLTRQGHQTTWMGRVGTDELGTMVLSTLRGEGVDTGAATVDPTAPTGLMIKGPRSSLVTDVIYYRRNSAASHLAPQLINHALIEAAKVLYVTGITAALSDSARETVMSAIDTAEASGTRVAFDPNYRSALWDHEEASKWFREIAARSDVVLAGLDEASIMFGPGTPKELVRQLAGIGSSEAIIKLGAKGTLALIGGSQISVSAPVVEMLDPVGAGDAFAAGYFAGWLEGQEAAECLDRACRTAALAVSAQGDWEGLPTADEVDGFPETAVRR